MDKIADLARAIAATAALAFAGVISTMPYSMHSFLVQPIKTVLTGDPGGPTVNGTEPMIEYAVRQGGALAVLLIVLFFYRRDYRYLTESWREQSKQNTEMLTELVKQNTKAQTDTAAALRENNVVVHQAKNVMQHILPARRLGERPPEMFDSST